jgi:hypothetical protein
MKRSSSNRIFLSPSQPNNAQRVVVMVPVSALDDDFILKIKEVVLSEWRMSSFDYSSSHNDMNGFLIQKLLWLHKVIEVEDE